MDRAMSLLDSPAKDKDVKPISTKPKLKDV
jgi:hypothetical protein